MQIGTRYCLNRAFSAYYAQYRYRSPITIRHCANDLVILNKDVLHIVGETVKAVCKKFVFYNLRGLHLKYWANYF